MSFKSLALSAPDFAASVLSAPSFLRIAVPSWRSVGINTQVEAEPESPTLSREEIQALFHGELNGRTPGKRRLTNTEKEERDLAERIRQALYPYSGGEFSN
ncbi:hypothetical protein DEA8626_01831 [Defluviimonas aquaemixtae]|uniref:Uncharacterized protein n=2 Tax=Albidovulum aquaemixtae TaxID=1542388 RepID=A0A2R8B6V0_9RHOB|nr:hypothetical protein DEA8626_01831 [Defluviimonas aquaemixtae]